MHVDEDAADVVLPTTAAAVEDAATDMVDIGEVQDDSCPGS
jgi:hypothetical protein